MDTPAFAGAAGAVASTAASSAPLAGRTVLVTGASRGIGRGVAVALGEAGATVYVTGRSRAALQETAELVRAAAPARAAAAAAAASAGDGGGGPAAAAAAAVCTPLIVDHSDDAAVAELFRKIDAAEGGGDGGGGGGLDLLVNNAFGGATQIVENMELAPWEKGTKPVPGGTKPLPGGAPGAAADAAPGAYWDSINNVGLRSNYVAFVHAARGMVRRRRGLIVNVSSFGGKMSLFDAVYGCGKAANDRLMAELAKSLVEPVDTGVRAVTLYPGLVATEMMSSAAADAARAGDHTTLGAMMWNAESPLYVGRVVAALAAEGGARARDRRNGRIVVAAEAGNAYGVRDAGGERRYSFRSLKAVLGTVAPALRAAPLFHLVPDLLVPWWAVSLFTSAEPRFTR